MYRSRCHYHRSPRLYHMYLLRLVVRTEDLRLATDCLVGFQL